MTPRPIVFTVAEYRVLLDLVLSEQRSGQYYGNREAYYKRLAIISSKLRQSVEEEK